MDDTTLYRIVDIGVDMAEMWESLIDEGSLVAVDEPLFSLTHSKYGGPFVFHFQDRDYLIDGDMVHVNDVEPEADCDSAQCSIHNMVGEQQPATGGPA